jgi:glycosyltransferase involved in cell wall biosynthesis
MGTNKFAIFISTKNRKDDLLLTLHKIAPLLDDVQCVVFDDGSTDGTSEAIQKNFPQITLKRNAVSRGYMFCRNAMLNETDADFAISLDDDAHFLSVNPLEDISVHFNNNPNCGVIAFRIFWGKDAPETTATSDVAVSVKGFVGCGHAWRLAAWRSIPNYPEWFRFYGEEHFAALQLFKKGFTADYLPGVLVQHRVNMQARRKNTADTTARFRNALRADWYNYFLFYPILTIPRKMAYSLKTQFSTKIFNGQPQLFPALAAALWDLLRNMPRIIRNRNALDKNAYRTYMKLPGTKIFWKP